VPCPPWLTHAVACLAIALAVLSNLVASAEAQDSHYWTRQYGPRSSLLGGAVIGSVSDVSGTFYNPGALALAERLPFTISTQVYELRTVTLEDGAGEGVDLSSTKSGLQPSLLAGTIPLRFLGDDVLAYSLLTRAQHTTDGRATIIESGSELPPDVDLEDLVGVSQITGRYNDMWGGLSYSHGFGSHFGLGLTWYGAFRTQRRQRETVTQGIETDGSGSSAIDLRSGKYTAIRTLVKIGAYAAAGPLTAGLTFTTPSLHVTGWGEIGESVSAFGPDTTTLAATTQTDLPAEYKSPLSVGGGLGLRLGATRLVASAEWFDAIDPYVVLQGEDYLAQEPEEVRSINVVQSADQVFNWGVGVQHSFSERTTAYASFYTDRSAFSRDVARADLSLSGYDILSVFAGVDFVVSSARITLGAGYGWGNEPAQELTDLLREQDPDFDAKFVYRSFRLMFGFELGL
jgi:hypothetical protein